MACVKRDTTELGRPNWFLHRQVGEADQKTGKLKTRWESNQLIVLRGRESRSHGEGTDGNTKPAKETLAVPLARSNSANLPVGNSEEVLMGHQSGRVAAKSLPAEASIHEEPGAGKLHAGICAGAVG